jgi:hypothetical protein
LRFKLDNLVASQPTLSRFIAQISEDELAGITKLVTKLAQLVITQKKQHQLFIDLDSTHADTFGQQEGSNLKPIIKRTTIISPIILQYFFRVAS